MFEKLKEYWVYMLLWIIALWALAYAYVQTTNSQKWAELHEANLDAMVTNMSKSEKLKKNTTVAEELLLVNWWKTIWQYRIDDTKVSYVVWETYDTIFNNKKTVDISSDLDVTDWKLRLILIANPATKVDWEDVNTVNLNSDKSISYWTNNIESSNLKNVANELKWYNISAIWYWPFANEQEAKDFRDDYFSQYEIYQIWETWKYIILTEYHSTWSTESLSWKIDSKTSTLTSTNEWWDICNEYLCLDANWVTMKAKPDTACWQEYEFQWQNYYVVCDNPTLLNQILWYWYNPISLTNICWPSACQPWYTPNNVITTKMTSLNGLLYNVRTFNSDISSWDVSNVTNTAYAFRWTAFDQDIWYWNVSNVTDMGGMFSSSNFNNWWSDSIKNWDTSNVTDMGSMFSYTNFNQPIWWWNTSNVTNMGYMFTNTPFNQPIWWLNTSKVTNMDWMFSHTDSFNQDIWGWDVSNVESMSEMFYEAHAFNNWWSDSIWSWNTSKVWRMARMFKEATSFNQNISSWNVSHVSWRQRTPKSTFDEWTSDSWTSDKKPNFN